MFVTVYNPPPPLLIGKWLQPQGQGGGRRQDNLDVFGQGNRVHDGISSQIPRDL